MGKKITKEARARRAETLRLGSPAVLPVLDANRHAHVLQDAIAALGNLKNSRERLRVIAAVACLIEDFDLASRVIVQLRADRRWTSERDAAAAARARGRS